jgi:hypothetical protein
MVRALQRQTIVRAMLLALAWLPACLASAPSQTTAPQAACDVYVATNGDDGNPGTLSAPWRTVQHAADVLVPGQTVCVRSGVYGEAVTVHVSGSAAGGAITLRNYPGETPILDGASLTVPDGSAGLFLLEDRSYLVIQGFELRNYRTAARDRTPVGIHLRGATHHVVLRGNHVHDVETNYPGSDGGNAHGIAAYGTSAPASLHDLLVDGNELDHLRLGFSESLALNGNVEVFTITNNLVHDNNNIGIDLIGFEGTAPDPAYDQARNGLVRGNTVYNIDSYGNPAYGTERSAGGIYVDGGRDIVVERNVVHDADIGVELASEHAGHSTDAVTLRSNLIFGNLVAGVALGGYDTLRGRTENCAILNNTLFHNDALDQGNGELLLQYDTRNNTIANNILYATAQDVLIANPFTQNTGNSVDYNLYYAPGGAAGSAWEWQAVTYAGFGAYQAGTGNDAHGLFVDPQLVNVTLPDLHLRAGSPAIDRGANLPGVGVFDIDGEVRIENLIDIGADEVVRFRIALPTVLR